jgi:hypothetical protein
MPSINTAKYRTFLARRLKETLAVKEAYENLVLEIDSLTPNLNGSFANTNALLADIAAASSRLYLAVGRPTDWTDDPVTEATETDNNPPTPRDIPQYIDFAYWRDLLAAKRIMTNDASYVIPRRNWTANTVYDQYDDQGLNGNTAVALTSGKIYVLDNTSLPYSVYKCLWNNNGAASTIAPSTTGNTLTPVTTSDGYVWQFMYAITSTDKFLTSLWMPVKTDPDVKMSAEDNAGQLWEAVPLVLVNPGPQNFNPNGTFTFTYSGDGNGAVINASSLTIVSNTITKIQTANGGAGYTTLSTVTVTQGSSTATARALIPPHENHGYDPETELGPASIMLSVELSDDELDKLTTVNNYRRILLLSDPVDANGAVANSSFYKLTYDLTLASNTGVFQPDDTIAVSNTAYPVTAVVVDVVEVGANTVLRLTNVNDLGRSAAFQPGDTITDTSREGVSAIVNSANDAVSAAELTTFSGDIIYVDQRAPVTREPGQSERINLVFRFD